MFNAGIKGYSGARGILGALRARAPHAGLVEQLLSTSDAGSCASQLRSLDLLRELTPGPSPADLEKNLRTGCIIFTRKITNFVGGPAKRFIDAYTLRYAFHNLKVLFRDALTRRTDFPDNLYPRTALYVDSRRRAALDTPEKVIAHAVGTPLEKPANLAYDVYQNASNDLFLFELALDREYALLLWQAAKRVNLSQGRRLKKLVRPYLALNAVVWGLWLKINRSMSPEEIMNLLPVPSDIIGPGAYLDILRSGKTQDIADAVGVAAPGLSLGDVSAPADVTAWHRLARRLTWNSLAAKKLTVIFDISTLMIAIMRWEFVVDDLITVTAAKSLGLAREEIAQMLATVVA